MGEKKGKKGGTLGYFLTPEFLSPKKEKGRRSIPEHLLQPSTRLGKEGEEK